MEKEMPKNEIDEAIYQNSTYIHITEQMEDVHAKQITLNAKLDEIMTQIHKLDAEWTDLYNMRLGLKNIFNNKANIKLAKNQEAAN